MIVFTNGCFDQIHIGHIRLLRFASDLGDKLLVGINSDASVERLKGKGRPVYPLAYRVEVLLSIKYIHSVHVFEEDTPINLIHKIKPDIIVKGGDYKPEDVVGKDCARVVIFPLVEV